MSVFSALAHRFQNLTTDAQPDPPRIVIEGRGPNPDPSPELKPKSVPVTPEPEKLSEISPDANGNERSQPKTSTPEPKFSKGEPRPKSPRTKSKPKSKTAGGANLVIINSSGLNIGTTNNITYNMNQYTGKVTIIPEGPTPKTKHEAMSEDVVKLSSSKEELSMADMFIIKTHMGRGWRDVARKLGYSEGQIEQFEENNRDKVDEIIYQILLDWKQANTKDAQLGDLISKMWSCQEYDCVHQLVESHKKSS